MNAYYRKLLALAFAVAIGLLLIDTPSIYAGDPEDTIGPIDDYLIVCADDRHIPVSDLEGDGLQDDGTIDYTAELDLNRLQEQCDELNTMSLEEEETGKEIKGWRVEPIQLSRIEGYVYEFHPVDPENPAESEWFAVPSRDVPVIAEGVTFEIFWGSEPDGYFYYPNTFGEGPIMLNLRLPEDAHQVNPDILIESTGLGETWTVFLGFYRGDIPPPNIDQLRTPDGNFLPFGNTTFESIVGLDGKSALPGVGGVLPDKDLTPVKVLAAAVLVILSAAGVFTLRRNRSEIRI